MFQVNYWALFISLSLVVQPLLILTATNYQRSGDVDPLELASVAYQNPSMPFQARILVTQWQSDNTKAEEVEIYFTPPNSYRMEFFSLNGNLVRVVQMNGDREQVTLMENGKAAHVYSHPHPKRLLPHQQQEDLLSYNYTASIIGSDQMIGRPVWVVELKPLSDGKPIQQLKIDQGTRVILELKRSIPNEKFGSITRFIKFEPQKSLSQDLFLASSLGGLETPLETSRPIEMGETPASLLKLPGGFMLNGLDVFDVEGTSARHFSYTDGALTLSVFQTTLPVEIPKETSVGNGSQPAVEGLASANQVRHWESAKKYFTLIGEVSQDLLKTISASIK